MAATPSHAASPSPVPVWCPLLVFPSWDRRLLLYTAAATITTTTTTPRHFPSSLVQHWADDGACDGWQARHPRHARRLRSPGARTWTQHKQQKQSCMRPSCLCRQLAAPSSSSSSSSSETASRESRPPRTQSWEGSTLGAEEGEKLGKGGEGCGMLTDPPSFPWWLNGLTLVDTCGKVYVSRLWVLVNPCGLLSALACRGSGRRSSSSCSVCERVCVCCVRVRACSCDRRQAPVTLAAVGRPWQGFVCTDTAVWE